MYIKKLLALVVLIPNLSFSQADNTKAIIDYINKQPVNLDNDIEVKNGLCYKRGTNEPFSGFAEGKWNQSNHENGIIWSGNYINGKKDGLWIVKGVGGTKFIEIEYSNGIESKITEFGWRGEVLSDTVNAIYGVEKRADSLIYRSNNSPEASGTPPGMVPFTGVGIAWANGYKLEGKYKNGLKDGIWKNWYENGHKARELNFNKGKLLSEKYWDKQGNESNKKIDGSKNGYWTAWHQNGLIKSEGSYVNGEKNGLWKQWDNHGIIESEGSYKMGKQEGFWTFSNGEAGEYKNGKRVGGWHDQFGRTYTENEFNLPDRWWVILVEILVVILISINSRKFLLGCAIPLGLFIVIFVVLGGSFNDISYLFFMVMFGIFWIPWIIYVLFHSKSKGNKADDDMPSGTRAPR